jgi:type II secretory pathway component GspD/PulD (secretin)
MRNQWTQSLIVGLIGLLLSVSAYAADGKGEIQLKPGEMGLLPFLEMVSDKLDIQIDASRLSGSDLGTVTVPDLGAVSRERAQAVVLTTLYLQGYTWIHDSVIDLYRIVHQRDARDEEVPLITDQAQLPDSDLLVTYIMPIQHTPAEYIARTMRSFMPANSRIIPDETTSSVLITDSAHNIAKLKTLVQRIDTPEVAKEAKEFLAARAKKSEGNCPALASESRIQQPWVLIGLFSLIALVIGFLMRGYVIRRIEGGL